MIAKTGQFRRLRFTIEPERGTAAYIISARYYGRVITVRTTDSSLYRLVSSNNPDTGEKIRRTIYQLIRQGWLGSPTKKTYEALQKEQAGTGTTETMEKKKPRKPPR